jgi:hypothetical protein
VLCPPLSFCTEVNIHVTCIPTRVVQFEHFDDETFAFFRDVLFENYPSWISQWLRLVPNFGKGCKIFKSSFLEFQISLIFPFSSVLSTPFLLLSVKCRKRGMS